MAVRINIYSKELKDNLNKIPERCGRAMLDTAWYIVKTAKEVYVPVDTGDLRNSISIEKSGYTKANNYSIIITAGNLHPVSRLNKTINTVTVNRSGMDYAEFVEAGRPKSQFDTRKFSAFFMQNAIDDAIRNQVLIKFVAQNLSAAYFKATGRYDVNDTMVTDYSPN